MQEQLFGHDPECVRLATAALPAPECVPVELGGVEHGRYSGRSEHLANDQFRHFGLGQTETSVELKPGTHTLQLLVADQNHIPHHPVVMSERITITVR